MAGMLTAMAHRLMWLVGASPNRSADVSTDAQEGAKWTRGIARAPHVGGASDSPGLTHLLVRVSARFRARKRET